MEAGYGGDGALKPQPTVEKKPYSKPTLTRIDVASLEARLADPDTRNQRDEAVLDAVRELAAESAA